MERIDREKMFISIAFLLAERSTCERAKVGAVMVRDNRIVSTGYGGAPSQMPHCTDEGCIIGPDEGCSRTVHAEVNAVAFAAKHGVALEGTTLYVTHAPCYNCAKVLINAGIKEVWFKYPYRDHRGVELLMSRGIKTQWYKDEDLD